MRVAQNVDLNKYMGKWHEIARLPNSFQKGFACSTADYKIIDNDYISVTNQCNKNGVIKTSTAKAWRANHDDNSKLKVRFFWPFTGNYWILYVSSNYKYAVVGEPSREYLWFLSRTKSVDRKSFNLMKKVALSQGYDLNKLISADNTDC
jgi:apolipoprotein D and lipocalin family protein